MYILPAERKGLGDGFINRKRTWTNSTEGFRFHGQTNKWIRYANWRRTVQSESTAVWWCPKWGIYGNLWAMCLAVFILQIVVNGFGVHLNVDFFWLWHFLLSQLCFSICRFLCLKKVLDLLLARMETPSNDYRLRLEPEFNSNLVRLVDEKIEEHFLFSCSRL